MMSATKSLPLRLAAFSALVALCAFGCVSLLELDGYASAIGELCGRFNQCFDDSYGKCENTASGRLSGAPESTRAAWLVDFNDDKCLTQCSNARACMDSNPICGALGSSCFISEECCSFSASVAACLGGKCCVLDGRDCSDASECCNGVCINNLCGGIECSVPGEYCEGDGDCCEGLLCNRDINSCFQCRSDGEECSIDAECCGDCIGGKCQSECHRDGEPCKTGADCCNSLCVPVSLDGGDAMLCNSCDGGLPTGAPCIDHTACCSGLCDSFVAGGTCQECRPDGVPCNGAAQCCSAACTNDFCGTGNCSVQGEPCMSGATCCSGACNPSAMFGCCASKANPPCDHGVCEVGEWLTEECDPGLGGVNGADGCISKICSADPYCCCVGWDQICVQQVADECQLPCPVGTPSN